MHRTNTIVIGAGQAGLATSRCLTDRGIDHIVLERGTVADRWQTARWDSLRLLSPSWQSTLPGWSYRGDDPTGYMTMPEITDHLRRYALSFEAPIATRAQVFAVRPSTYGYRIESSRGEWAATNVVVATGAADVPFVPSTSAAVQHDILQISPTEYRNPAQLPHGGVLVVGASASGVQLADELARAGRHVTIAVGSHNRMRRQHRGADIMWWLERIGHFDTVLDRERDPRDETGGSNSLQLIGSPERRDLDLVTLQRLGVRVCGRLRGIRRTIASFADDLAETTSVADARLRALLRRLDDVAAAEPTPCGPPDGRPVVPVSTAGAVTELDLADAGINTIVWATGFRRDHSWLRVPILDPAGDIVQRHGITAAPGIYTVGMRHQRTRHSTSIGGVGADAAFVGDHVLANRTRRSLTRTGAVR